MTEEYQDQFDSDEDGGSYYDDEEEQAGDNEQEDEYEGQDVGDIQIGEEIELTHKDVWDDSALIEAWDAAVKQYEVYHSKTKAPISATSTSTSTTTPILAKSKNKVEQSAITTSPSKRSKPNGDTSGAIKGDNDISESGEMGKAGQEAPHVPAQSKPDSTEAEYAVTERKPSFRKADKPSFNHRKDDRKTNGGARGDGASGVSTAPTKSATTKTSVHRNQKAKAAAAAATTPSNMPAPVDAATIAYYQQLGYYYDPSYDNSSQGAELGEGFEEEGGEEGGEQQQQQGNGATRSNNRAPAFSSNATLSKSSTFAKNRAQPSSSSSPSAAAPPIAPFGSGSGSGSMPMYSPHQHQYQHQHGFYSGYPAHIPAAGVTGAHGGFGVPGAPGMGPMWRGPGAGSGPYGPGPGPIPAGGRHYPMGMMPPPPLSGQVSAAGMDDEALSNLIMAWYFSGYYTGLYQAQRR